MRRRRRRVLTSPGSSSEELARLGMPREMVLRHRLPHFASPVFELELRGGLLRLHVG